MKVAIIGGIGSGKSAVRNILSKNGYHTIDSDAVNAKMMTNTEYIKMIDKAFNGVVIGGVIDKTALKNMIFADENKRLKLNSIAHPMIKNILINEMDKFDLVFVEVPLLTECGLAEYFDRIWLIKADKDTRQERVIKRDNISRDLFFQINSSQVDDRIREEVATDIIHNDGSLESLENTVLTKVRELKALK